MICFSSITLLSVFYWASLVHGDNNYVIFGGTPAVVRTRMDPIASPGTVSTHLHEVFGGSGFSENYEYDRLIQSECTTMPIPQDFSNYWVPPMFYVDPNNGSYTLMKSTMNIYYLIRPGPNNDVIHPFPPGLRMFAGNNTRGSYNASNPSDQAISYVCLDYTTSHTGDPDWAEREDFFDHQCPDGMRAQVFFPSCWDGQNLDSPDHISHMSYPIGSYNDGYCPSSHPVHLISLFYELFVPTGDFPYHGAGTWILGNGDTRGLRFHGDFVMGWNNTEILQQFISNCPNALGSTSDCPAFAAVQDTNAPAACQFSGKIVDEDIGDTAAINTLPGCNTPWDGTGPQPVCPLAATPGLVQAIQPLPSGWSDLGCIAEGTAGRAFTGASVVASNMTKAVCGAWCGSRGFVYAGVEFGDECYCGTTFSNGASQALVASEQCSSRCAGNSLETCGGPSRLELLYNPQPGTSSSPTSPSTSSPASTSTPASVTWQPGGCVVDSVLRALTGYVFSTAEMTPTLCQQVCAAKQFTIAGLEFGTECYCGNSFANGLGQPVSQSFCLFPCVGDTTATCGGAFLLSIYKQTSSAG